MDVVLPPPPDSGLAPDALLVKLTVRNIILKRRTIREWRAVAQRRAFWIRQKNLEKVNQQISALARDDRFTNWRLLVERSALRKENLEKVVKPKIRTREWEKAGRLFRTWSSLAQESWEEKQKAWRESWEKEREKREQRKRAVLEASMRERDAELEEILVRVFEAWTVLASELRSQKALYEFSPQRFSSSPRGRGGGSSSGSCSTTTQRLMCHGGTFADLRFEGDDMAKGLDKRRMPCLRDNGEDTIDHLRPVTLRLTKEFFQKLSKRYREIFLASALWEQRRKEMGELRNERDEDGSSHQNGRSCGTSMLEEDEKQTEPESYDANDRLLFMCTRRPPHAPKISTATSRAAAPQNVSEDVSDPRLRSQETPADHLADALKKIGHLDLTYDVITARDNFLLVGWDLRNAMLSSANLAGVDLSCARLNDAFLKKANLAGARMQNADLRGATLREARFDPEGMPKELVRVQDASRIARLQGADFRGCAASRCCFKEAVLRGCDMRGGCFAGANFELCKFAGNSPMGTGMNCAPVGLTNVARLDGASFEGAQFSPGVLLCHISRKPGGTTGTQHEREPRPGGERTSQNGQNKLERVLLKPRMSMRNANFSDATLAGALFNGSDARKADFSSANLENASFQYADLRGSVFSGANLKGVDLSGAVVDKHTKWDDADLVDADTRGLVVPRLWLPRKRRAWNLWSEEPSLRRGPHSPRKETGKKGSPSRRVCFSRWRGSSTFAGAGQRHGTKQIFSTPGVGGIGWYSCCGRRRGSASHGRDNASCFHRICARTLKLLFLGAVGGGIGGASYAAGDSTVDVVVEDRPDNEEEEDHDGEEDGGDAVDDDLQEDDDQSFPDPQQDPDLTVGCDPAAFLYQNCVDEFSGLVADVASGVESSVEGGGGGSQAQDHLPRESNIRAAHLCKVLVDAMEARATGDKAGEITSLETLLSVFNRKGFSADVTKNKKLEGSPTNLPAQGDEVRVVHEDVVLDEQTSSHDIRLSPRKSAVLLSATRSSLRSTRPTRPILGREEHKALDNQGSSSLMSTSGLVRPHTSGTIPRPARVALSQATSYSRMLSLVERLRSVVAAANEGARRVDASTLETSVKLRERANSIGRTTQSVVHLGSTSPPTSKVSGRDTAEAAGEHSSTDGE